MNNLNQGSIVLVDFSYSNQYQSKLRPALVISSTANNRISRDVVVMKITKNEPNLWGICISNDDLAEGSLAHPSFVQVDGIYSLRKEYHPRCDWSGDSGKNA
jgi:mRNA-degrading endonuclease toxin of MazEF toxin-antitoxin module